MVDSTKTFVENVLYIIGAKTCRSQGLMHDEKFPCQERQPLSLLHTLSLRRS